ncbi:hypothetical protein ACP4OV_012368 [Aristida adscensionis]
MVDAQRAMEGAGSELICREKITGSIAALFADLVQVPKRFIRTDEIQATGVVSEDYMYELPIVDIANLHDLELSALETTKLGSACRDQGFFQLINHRVDEAVIQQMKETTIEFFSLPLEDKSTIALHGKDMFQGYDHHFSGSPDDKLDWAECVLLWGIPVPKNGSKQDQTQCYHKSDLLHITCHIILHHS